jgi:hypothetical protein
MAELIPSTTFTIKLTERETNVVLKAIGLLAGVVGIHPPSDEERDLAADINRRMLLHERMIYRERLKHAENKLSHLGVPADDADEPDADQDTPTPRRLTTPSRGWRSDG